MTRLTIRSNKPSDIQDFVKRNEPFSSDGTAGDSLKNYQQNHGGTGGTFYDIETSWIAAQGYTTYGLLLNALGYVSGSVRERIRNFLLSYTDSVSYYMLENNTDRYLLEDGSGYYILE